MADNNKNSTVDLSEDMIVYPKKKHSINIIYKYTRWSRSIWTSVNLNGKRYSTWKLFQSHRISIEFAFESTFVCRNVSISLAIQIDWQMASYIQNMIQS